MGNRQIAQAIPTQTEDARSVMPANSDSRPHPNALENSLATTICAQSAHFVLKTNMLAKCALALTIILNLNAYLALPVKPAFGQ